MDSFITKTPQIWTVGRGLLTNVYYYVHLQGPHGLQYDEIDENVDFRILEGTFSF